MVTPARSSPLSLTPFSLRSSRGARPRARATSSMVSPKRSTTVSTRSAVPRARSNASANAALVPTGIRTATGARSGGVRSRNSCEFSDAMTSGRVPAARAIAANVVPGGASTRSKT